MPEIQWHCTGHITPKPIYSLFLNPEYYTQNEKGEVIDPINPDTGESWGWADVADLNYDNNEMRQEMIQDMLYWV